MEQNHKPAKEQFDDNSIKVLEWNEHIQRRPEMYIDQLGDGSDPKDGIYTLLKGVLVMAMDEFQFGFGKGFSVEAKNDYVVVRDYGRGIPLESVVSATSGISVGIGANPQEVTIHPVKVTNALSISFYVESIRDGVCSWAEYYKGHLLCKGMSERAEDNGTYIKFVPDPDVFEGYAFREDIVKEILQNTARQNKGLSISFNGDPILKSK
jgi:topoisomerase-4 subunit B